MDYNIGFIGLGAMGKPMAINLVKKGYSVTVYDIRQEPMDDLKAVGANVGTSSKDVAEKSDVIITMLLSSPHVEEAVLGEGGVIEGAKEGTVPYYIRIFQTDGGMAWASPVWVDGVSGNSE